MRRRSDTYGTATTTAYFEREISGLDIEFAVDVSVDFDTCGGKCRAYSFDVGAHGTSDAGIRVELTKAERDEIGERGDEVMIEVEDQIDGAREAQVEDAAEARRDR